MGESSYLGSIRPDCGCPDDEGLIRHQRATCTDPVVAKLGWYFDPRPCGRCGSLVAKPGDTRPDGRPSMFALWCEACLDRCHEATDFAHVCQVCATPEEGRRYGWKVPADG